MIRLAIPALLAATVASCGGADTGRAATPASRTNESVLDAKTRITVTLRDSLNSRVNKSGETVRASVATDVVDAKGRVVIPAGSAVTFTIVKLEPGSDQVRPEGRLELAPATLRLNDASVPLHAAIGPIPHTMKGRGITKDEAGRIAAGTAVGAGVGQVIGKNTRSTVIGAAVGAVAGGAVAVKYAYRDVVVTRGTQFTITLTQPLTIAN